jgi:hypothetical protein
MRRIRFPLTGAPIHDSAGTDEVLPEVPDSPLRSLRNLEQIESRLE